MLPLKKPTYLKVRLQHNLNYAAVKEILANLTLNTVCQEAGCPNIFQCFSDKTATFLILGPNCTRNCTFCLVKKEKPLPVDELEPSRIAEAVFQLKLKHCVVTSVTRDDLADGGARHFAKTIRAMRKKMPQTTIEVLIPDFQGNIQNQKIVFQEKPQILNHNIETVEKLYSKVRPQANYSRSLNLLKNAKQSGLVTKSGLMVGLGENKEELIEAIANLREVNCDLLTIGQYLRPTSLHYPVYRYYHPQEFEELKQIALSISFKAVESKPLVRSSYKASEQLSEVRGG